VRALVVLAAATVAAHGPRANLSCTIQSASVDFGVYDPLGTARTEVMGQVQLHCTQGATPQATVTLSTGDSGNFFDRTMVNPPNALHYNLFTDDAYVQVAGDGSNGTLPLAASASPGGGMKVYPFYGVIAPSQNVPAGVFSDNIVVEVTF
jgi:spore coat protein U-like protein